MVRLRRMTAPSDAEVLLKLEYVGLGGSIKDRAALAMILEAERNGALKPGGAIVEASGGNTGVGLALVCAARGYRCTIVVPKGTAREKLAVLDALGASVIEDDDFVATAARLARESGAVLPNQFDNPENPACHVATTGPEILSDTQGELDALVVCVGSGGTLAGLTKFFSDHAPHVQIVVATPSKGDSLIEGVSELEGPVHGVSPREVVHVDDVHAIATARRLAREEGILAGGSTGLATYAALEVARRLGPGKRVVAIAADTARNYLSTYFDATWRTARGLL
jgi:cysteine synthase